MIQSNWFRVLTMEVNTTQSRISSRKILFPCVGYILSCWQIQLRNNVLYLFEGPSFSNGKRFRREVKISFLREIFFLLRNTLRIFPSTCMKPYVRDLWPSVHNVFQMTCLCIKCIKYEFKFEYSSVLKHRLGTALMSFLHTAINWTSWWIENLRHGGKLTQ